MRVCDHRWVFVWHMFVLWIVQKFIVHKLRQICPMSVMNGFCVWILQVMRCVLSSWRQTVNSYRGTFEMFDQTAQYNTNIDGFEHIFEWSMNLQLVLQQFPISMVMYDDLSLFRVMNAQRSTIAFMCWIYSQSPSSTLSQNHFYRIHTVVVVVVVDSRHRHRNQILQRWRIHDDVRSGLNLFAITFTKYSTISRVCLRASPDNNWGSGSGIYSAIRIDVRICSRLARKKH